jgi:hypothetical protein
VSANCRLFILLPDGGLVLKLSRSAAGLFYLISQYVSERVRSLLSARCAD